MGGGQTTIPPAGDGYVLQVCKNNGAQNNGYLKVANTSAYAL